MGVLPEHYPKPINNEPAITTVKVGKGGIPTAQEMIDEFPSVFDGQVRVMDGEHFRIALAPIAPLRPLLSTKTEFTWTTEHDQALAKTKECLTTAPALAFFDVDKPTRVCTDASRQGLGFVMQQQTAEGQWRLVQAGSRCLTDAESRYAVIELELLAVTWAIWKCRVF